MSPPEKRITAGARKGVSRRAGAGRGGGLRAWRGPARRARRCAARLRRRSGRRHAQLRLGADPVRRHGRRHRQRRDRRRRDPRSDRRRLVGGAARRGAWTETPDGARIGLAVAAAEAGRRDVGFAAWWLLDEPLRSQLCANLARTGTVSNYRCAAHEYRLLAGGHAHFSAFTKLMVWDHAAGWRCCTRRRRRLFGAL